MTGSVTYMCRCLNIGIYVANKYFIEDHKRDKFVTLEGSGISGWKFELDKKGVAIKYSSFVSARRTMDWVTFSCHNCNSGDIYSVKKRPNIDLTYPIDISIMGQSGDQVIVHRGTISGEDIDKMQKNTAYSNVFQIVLNPDLPVNYASLEKEEGECSDTELLSEQKQIQQVLRQSLIGAEEATEKRIQQYQREQESKLNREKEKAKYDAAVLWQMMKGISRTIHNEEKYIKRFNNSNTKEDNINNNQSLLNGNAAQKTRLENNIQGLPKDLLEVEMLKRESHVEFSHHKDFTSHHNQQRRRSSAFKRDLFGGFAIPTSSHRRPSYALDESSIAKSFKKQNHLPEVVIDELPPFQRRSSLIPSTIDIHPLATRSPQQRSTTTNIEISLNGYPREQKDEQPELKDEESEDMFALDEDMETSEDDMITDERRLPGRRPSTKYLNDDMNDNMEGVWPTQTETNFATSVPIAITHPTPASANTEMHPNSSVPHPLNSFMEPNQFNHNRTRQTSFVGFDYAEADRETSSLFPPTENNRYRRKSSSVISYKNKAHNYHTRYYSGGNKMDSDNKFINEEEEEEEGPMIPPHILAANTVTDETEAIFGSVPRSSVRYKPVV